MGDGDGGVVVSVAGGVPGVVVVMGVEVGDGVDEVVIGEGVEVGAGVAEVVGEGEGGGVIGLAVWAGRAADEVGATPAGLADGSRTGPPPKRGNPRLLILA